MIFRVRDLEDYERSARYHSDLWRVRGVTRPATAISEALSYSGRAEVFAYRFDWDELPHFLGADLAVLLGAAHGFEVPFVFGTFDLGSPLFNRLVFDDETEASRVALSARLMSYWAEFARSGRPGTGSDGKLPLWTPWTESPTGQPGSASMLVLDTEASGGIRVVASRLSTDQVIAAVDAESGLDQNEKCELFHDLFSRSSDWNAERYLRIGRRGCADYPRE
jgi:para-nitrobenzyl esterase